MLSAREGARAVVIGDVMPDGATETVRLVELTGVPISLTTTSPIYYFIHSMNERPKRCTCVAMSVTPNKSKVSCMQLSLRLGTLLWIVGGGIGYR